MTSNFKIAFLGLGAMGSRMSFNLHQVFPPVRVFDIITETAFDHSEAHGTIACELPEIASACDLIFTCLPTSLDVQETYEELAPLLNEGTICVDCTSGDPFITREIGETLQLAGVHFLDCPVSGGPGGAEAGTIAGMLAGDAEIADEIFHVVEVFSRPSYVGELGCGHAIKALNNMLNTTHLCVAAEGLARLKKELGIDLSNSLEVINKSSGRSLMTMERVPKHIMEMDYDYGFKLGLMRKDVRIAKSIVKEPSEMFSTVLELLDEAVERYGYDADYTEVARLFFDEIDLI